MNRDSAFQSAPTPAEQPNRRPHVAQRQRHIERGAYTITEVCDRISLARSTFYRLRNAGELPFLEEVRPRLGKRARYRADLVEQFVANQFNRNPLAFIGRRSR